MKRSATNRRAFTLIELLVVVAIIVALLAILLPSMGRAIATAEMTVCGTRMKQIHIAMLAYVADNQRAHPHPQQWVTLDSYPTSWASQKALEDGQLWRYMQQMQDAYLCPTFKGVAQQFAGLEAKSSICMNVWFGHGNPAAGSWLGKATLTRWTEVRRPGSLMLLSDENPFTVPNYSTHAINNLAMGPGDYHNPASHVDSIGSFHLPQQGDYATGLSNVAFVDGHVEQRTIDDTKEVATPDIYK